MIYHRCALEHFKIAIMKFYLCVIFFSILFPCCSKTGNAIKNVGDVQILGTIAIGPENLRLKMLGNNSDFLQPEDFFDYDNSGRISSAIDSLTLQPASANTYSSICIYSGNGNIPVKINRYWIYWMNGLQSTPYLTGNYIFSSNTSGQITAISSDSSSISATFWYGNNYMVTQYFRKNQSARIYYDSALISANSDVMVEYKIYSDSSFSTNTSYDTLTYHYTSNLNPEYYVSLFEDPTFFYLGVPVFVVSNHMPSNMTSTLSNSSVNYTYQTDNQGRVTSQMDGTGKLIKTYSYF
jgi:hypothetical protein